MRFSSKTLSLLSQLIQYAIGTHNDIDLLIQEFDLQDEVQGLTVIEKGRQLVKQLGEEVKSDPLKENMIIELIEHILVRPQLRNCSSVHISDTYDRFRESLLLDGFGIGDNLKLFPHTPEPASLAPQLSKLEQNLESCGLSVALTHYQQAYKNFTDGHYESCNGQIRSFAENLIPEICKRITGVELINNPSAALHNLQQKNKIDKNEEGMFKNFWSHIQDEGPHQGVTTESEALYRLHMATVIARYLMEKLMQLA